VRPAGRTHNLLLLLLQVTKERDLIGVQLVRRNDEVSLLYEKIKILQMTLNKGERQYKERLEDIRLLKLEIRNQRCKNSMLEKRNQAVDDLRLGWHTYLSALVAVLCSGGLAIRRLQVRISAGATSHRGLLSLSSLQGR